MRDYLLLFLQVFPIVMNMVSALAGVLLFFAIKVKRRKRNAVHKNDTR